MTKMLIDRDILERLLASLESVGFSPDVRVIDNAVGVLRGILAQQLNPSQEVIDPHVLLRRAQRAEAKCDELLETLRHARERVLAAIAKAEKV